MFLYCEKKSKLYTAFNCIFGKIGRSASEEVIFALIKSKCLPILLDGTEACPTNSAVKHSLDFGINRVLFKIFGAMSNDTKTSVTTLALGERISARQDKITRVSESDVSSSSFIIMRFIVRLLQ